LCTVVSWGKGNKVDANTPWKTWTWKEYRDEVDAFGVSLLALGCAKFDVVNIIGFNAPEWFFANFGAIAAGCVPAGIYATNNSAACQYISQHSQAKVIVVEGVKQLEKYLEIAKNLPHLKAIVMYGPDALPANVKDRCTVPCYVWNDFLQVGKVDDGKNNESVLKERSASWKPGETCTLIYTSGTTGPPKAVMITNDNVTWTVSTMLLITRRGFMDNSDHMISYLPLSHIAAQMLDMHMPLSTGCQIHFAQPDALQGTLGMTLKEVRPTTFFGVPRVWEKIYDKLQEVAKASTGIKKMLSTWAKGKSTEYWQSQEFSSPTAGHKPFLLGLANKLLHKAHLALGFDRCYAFYVSAAPIEVKILRYFASINIPIMELFGQSECTGPHAVNLYSAFKIGTVGRPLPGTETKLGESDGELCYRGRHIFAGYMGMPDKTKETIDPEGWLHSGDVVKIDSDDHPNIPKPSGFITITGRIKELIITAGKSGYCINPGMRIPVH
jgi:long-chain-fatty-acid--CoA ligase ACSBG